MTDPAVLIRAFTSEVGEFDFERGILDCRFVPFNTRVQVTDVMSDGTLDRYVEEIAPSMFARQAKAHDSSIRRISFYDGHPAPGNPASKLGWTAALRAADDGLYGTLQVQPSAREDVQAMLADGIRDLSIGFLPAVGGTVVREDGSRLRVKGSLDHIALEPEGAYPGAAVLAMRAERLAEEDAEEEAALHVLERGELDAWLKEAEDQQAAFLARVRGIG